MLLSTSSASPGRTDIVSDQEPSAPASTRCRRPRVRSKSVTGWLTATPVPETAIEYSPAADSWPGGPGGVTVTPAGGAAPAAQTALASLVSAATRRGVPCGMSAKVLVLFDSRVLPRK